MPSSVKPDKDLQTPHMYLDHEDPIRFMNDHSNRPTCVVPLKSPSQR